MKIKSTTVKSIFNKTMAQNGEKRDTKMNILRYCTQFIIHGKKFLRV